MAAASTLNLPRYTSALIADNFRYHGDTCPAKPEVREAITIGGGTGVLLSYNCGILINLAAAVRDGVGYQFGSETPP